MSEAAAPAAPAAAPSNASESATFQGPLNDAFSHLDTMLATPNEGGGASPPPSAEGAAPSSDAGSTATAPKPSAADVSKSTSEKPPASTPPAEPPVEKMAPKQLREAYSALKVKMAEIQKERDQFKTAAETPKDDPEKKTLAERLEATEKRRAELEQVAMFADYKQSDEYKSKWQAPFVEAYNDGREAVAQIKVIGDDGNIRPGTQEDFDRYMRISDEDEAAQFAEQVFGNKKGMVEYHRMQTLQRNRARLKAVEDFQKNSGEIQKRRTEEMQAHQKTIAKIWQDSNKSAAEKYPHWFAPADGDAKGNELLEKGFHLADRAFSAGQPLREGDKPLSPQEMAALHSAVRNKAGGFDRLAFKFAQANKRIADLEKKIAEFESTVPGNGEGRGRTATEADGWEAQLDRMAQKR